MHNKLKKFVTTPSVTDGKVAGTYITLPPSPLRQLECGLRIDGKVKTSNDELPLVSVVTVVRNRADTIEKCLLSVLGQTYQNIEYILIDGGSSDNTLEIIKKYCDSIDYAVSEPDSGIYNAFNKGVSLAAGDYIVFLNSDDWYSADAISALVSHALSMNSDVTHANAYTVSGSGETTGTIKGWLNIGLLTRGMPARHETMLIKKEVYNKFGYYDESYSIIADYHYLIMLYTGGCSFSHLNEEILYFSLQGISNVDDDRRYSERARLFMDLFPFLSDTDIDIMKKKGRLSIKQRQSLVEKYRNVDGSELFIDSMIYNIGDSVAKGENNNGSLRDRLRYCVRTVLKILSFRKL